MNKRYRWLLILCAAVTLSANVLAANKMSLVEDAEATRCQKLTSEDFGGIQDAPSQVTEAKLAASDGDVPAYCDVRGYVNPNVGIEMKLPIANWNGKFLEMGCGGNCGVFYSSYSENLGHDCDQGLRKGYACLATDQGHQGTMTDAKWALNNLQAQIDYAFRAAHVASLAGKAITERYYGKAPHKSYFWGCSDGGYEAMSEAQKFPWDFDGIVAVAPVTDMLGYQISVLWNMRVATNAGKALFSDADVEWLHNEIMAKCDGDDGVKDGVIGNPLACKLDFSEWSCAAGGSKRCLSAAQIKALQQLYDGPINSKGERLGGKGIVPGLERAIPTTTNFGPLYNDGFKYRVMGYMQPPGHELKIGEFDFDSDYKRLAYNAALSAARNPDLSALKAAGGKLILVHGAVDSALTPLLSVDYYEKAERTMGGAAATQDFFRLFLVPGMDHCSGGPGASAIDYLSYIEDWSNGKAPDALIGAHIKEGLYKGWDYKLPADPAAVTFTRPIYPYPLHATYKGSGDPNDAKNFKAVH